MTVGPWSRWAVGPRQFFRSAAQRVFHNHLELIRTVRAIDEPKTGVDIAKDGDLRGKVVAMLVAHTAQHFKTTTIDCLKVRHPTFDLVAEDPHVGTVTGEVGRLLPLGVHEALSGILESLKDPHPGVRQSAITAVALLGDENNLSDLEPLRADRDADVASAAETAIQKLSASMKE